MIMHRAKNSNWRMYRGELLKKEYTEKCRLSNKMDKQSIHSHCNLGTELGSP
ncbi:hypothetical protein Sjap_004982 [Stephania japonica]|uniref:Uncharacterized protein n=1 Tax=Stephania japonica TaxID=461633 RepID=A0AAP0K4K1_9MAGN